MPEYMPTPIDTSGVAFPAELDALVEYLARNVHEVWAQRRLAEGWRYGPGRNEELKTLPGLVPYDDLTETEKEYDRATATETLKAILALGFRIEREVPG